jgi:hypothetical protein
MGLKDEGADLYTSRSQVFMERGQAQGILKETFNMAAVGKIHYIYLINVQTANNTTIVLSTTLPNSDLYFIHGIEFHLCVCVCVCFVD